ncbi:O-antigen ligase [Hymenobacter luteus]|uniref:O-antigen ligase n=2 Tax=Hymenobacter TaxID=89966 RepID=A0A7W9WAA3_9BACT|nr:MULTISPECIES: O-antigen ligase family protein [Hymenobacter]MBB4599992.1 O-antigen ligase [Hymenobacter latericoloratus]MBB6057698.1 O-antigen ligase [Hymenobacter luteus]
MISSLGSILTLQRLQIAATFFCICVILGLFTSSFFRILPSIGMAGLLATGIVSYGLHRKVYSRMHGSIYSAFSLVYIIHLVSGFLISAVNWGEYKRDIVLQLPFLILPLAFWLLPALPGAHLRKLWFCLIGAATTAALLSTVNYVLHFEQINELYLHSKVMPTEPDHIRFSLIITLAIAAGGALLMHQSITGIGKKLVVGAVLFLALYQHMLAVRSGLLTFYFLGGVTCLWLVMRRQQYYRALQLAAGLLLLPVLSYVCFPTFRNKSVNTREDVGRVEHTASANNYSLVGRVYSYKVALKVIKDNPWFGVGKADIESEMAIHYRQDYPTIQPEAYIQPHNQYLYSTVAFGGVGLLLFIIGFYYPGLSIWPRHAPLLLAQYIITTLSFLVEYTLETQIGLAFALFFLLLALEGCKSPASPEKEWRPA